MIRQFIYAGCIGFVLTASSCGGGSEPKEDIVQTPPTQDAIHAAIKVGQGDSICILRTSYSVYDSKGQVRYITHLDTLQGLDPLPNQPSNAVDPTKKTKGPAKIRKDYEVYITVE
jgi:hypothetical protein